MQHRIPTQLLRFSLTTAAAIAVALSTASPAAADVRTEARRHFRAGMELIQAGQLDEGVEELQEAYDILPHPNVLYNIGRAYAEAGRYEESLEYFEQYMASDPPDREEVRSFIAAIEQRLAATAGPSVAPDTSDTPGPANVPDVPAASEDEIQALEDAATQIETLAVTTENPALMARAERLRAVAQALREGGQTPDATPDGSDPDGTRPGDGTEPPGDGTEPTGDASDIDIATGQQDLYDESIVSSVGAAQNPLEAPNATSIITAQDIRLTGLTNVGELMRRVAGADVMNLTGSDVQVGFRGFNQPLSPRVLTLVNGRQAYVDVLGANFFELAAISVDDIERIEVVRGPASALYGANGFSGIINIITREPGDDPGTGVIVGGGQGDTLLARGWSSGRSGRFAYRMSAGYTQYDRFQQIVPSDRVDLQEALGTPELAGRYIRARGAFSFRVTDTIDLRLEAGINRGDSSFQAFGTLTDLTNQTNNGHVMATLDSEWVDVRVWWNRLVDTEQSLARADPLETELTSDTIDVDVRFARDFHLGIDHSLTLGAGYRWKGVQWTWFRQQPTENHMRIVFQDALRFSDQFQIVAGIRMDRHPILDRIQFAPRLAAVLQPAEGHAIRASYSTAFRNQTLLETYNFLDFPTPVRGISALNYGSEVARQELGLDRIKPEFIQSVELGYRNASSDFFDFDISVYYNRVEDIITLAEIRNFSLNENASGQVGYEPGIAAYTLGATLFGNSPAINQVFGGELNARLYPVDGLDVYANYAWNRLWLSDDPNLTADDRTSRHKLNVGVQYRAPFGLDLSVDFHYASAQTWTDETFNARGSIEFQEFDLPAYYLVNARLGYRMMQDKLDLGLVVYNLTNNRHRQHPRGQLLGLRVTGTAAYRF